jgi:uncharacterized protein (TIGR02466 family)
MASYQTKSAQPKRYLQTPFATPLYIAELDLNLTNLEHFCKNHQQKNKEGEQKSNNGGYQSNFILPHKGALNSLIKEIETNANIFAQQFLNKKVTQKIVNIWMNTNSYKDSNRVHNHPGSAISGVYYIKTPSSAGNIVFQHPAFDELGYYYNSFNSLPGDVNEPEEYNQFNNSKVTAPAIENTLYLFPSWLKHYVESNMNETEERISISFNISPSK